MLAEFEGVGALYNFHKQRAINMRLHVLVGGVKRYALCILHCGAPCGDFRSNDFSLAAKVD
ncbi:hypothetical protein QC823_15505 [Halomonas vilamensis]|uniref:Uncharacterized protein n=1 Tax=Vreelandella vilamensis TaxID=531309 RepID=A0ABU1H7U2_9GAMM|nr:hypothetical protein [Halomonas vilamensis]MDR5900371.1 hypothetical protein [Halomonas vilamensis]